MDLQRDLFLDQRMTMSMNQIQALKILSMDSVELTEFLQQEYMDNPLLEYEAGHREMSGREPLTYEKQYSDFVMEEDRLVREIPDEKKEGIEDFIMEQLDLKKYGEYELSVIKYLIAMLDDNGYLVYDLKQLSETLQADPKFLKNLIRELQALEPYGIFSKDLRSCLLRQLEVKGLKNSFAWKIVNLHLEDLMHGKIGNISRAMKISTSDVRKAIEQISKLSPRPMLAFVNHDLHYINPDILLSWDKDFPKIVLNDAYIENYSISDYYLNMMRQTQDEELLDYFNSKYNRIKMILSGIEQRRKTILAIADEIAALQVDFLKNNGALKSVTMTEIADKLGLSTSTVSRAVKGKYIQTCKSVIPFRKLFTNRISADNNENRCSSDEVKEVILEIIRREDPHKPFSDSELLELVKEKEIHISRRVIAKYRTELGIKSSFKRKI